MKKKAELTENDIEARMKKIEDAKMDILIKNANGPQPVTPMDVAKLMGMEDEYREWLFEEELKRVYEEVMKQDDEKSV